MVSVHGGGGVGGGCGGLILAETGKVMDKKERKDIDIENMFVAVETMTSIVMGLAMSMCVVLL